MRRVPTFGERQNLMVNATQRLESRIDMVYDSIR
jgi:hypothetical protein